MEVVVVVMVLVPANDSTHSEIHKIHLYCSSTSGSDGGDEAQEDGSSSSSNRLEVKEAAVENR